MTDDRNKKGAPNTAEVSVNWEGLRRFLGWQGSINELKRVELDRPEGAPQPKQRAAADD
jgi:hypothetical protein